MKSLLILVSICSLAFACAKKRPVQKINDLDSSRWSKGAFDNGKEWLYKVTIVDNGAESAVGFVGYQNQMQIGKFRFTEKRLEFYDSNELFGSDETTGKVINSWSGTHSEYHQAEVGGRVSNVESENNEIPWHQKNFFNVDWTSAIVSEMDSIPTGISCYTRASARSVHSEEEITPEHISFTVAVDYKKESSARCEFSVDNTTVHYKYSFIPNTENEEYQSYVYTDEIDPLMKKYGYFNTYFEKKAPDDRRRFVPLMNRWDPNKTHIFYFDADFPEEYKWIYNDQEKGIIARTNQIFIDNNIPTRFEIRENTGQKFGDLRYSFVKFIKDPERVAPLGYGPSDANPRTGEIIAANSMMWTYALKYYVADIRANSEYLKNQATTSSIYREMSKTLGLGPVDWTASAGFLNNSDIGFFYRYLLPEFTYGRRGNAFTRGAEVAYETNLATKVQDTLKTLDISGPTLEYSAIHLDEINSLNHAHSHEHDLSDNDSTIFKLDEAIAGAAGLQALPENTSDESIINDILYRVAIHEFGHNLNLRHNFYGSVDAQISRRPGQDLSKARTSSVMDYLSASDYVGLEYDWEAYDKAALAFAYSDGSVDLAKAVNYNYLYCTDEHVRQNPLCNAFDIGSAPTEILSSIIRRYDSAYRVRNFRNDRSYWLKGSSYGGIYSDLISMKGIVKMYQETFTSGQVEQELANLQFITPQVSATITNAIRSDITEAVKLAAAFYGAVIKQGSLDRPFEDRYDDFSGQLQSVGIFFDKLVAQELLMGDASFVLNPNFGYIPTSFMNMRDDPRIGPTIDAILLDSFVNAGDGYNGFDDNGRIYLAANAGRFFDFGGGQGAIDLMKIECYKPSSFEERFNIDPQGLNQGSNKATPNYAGAASPDDYFQDKGEVAVIEINDEIYVSATANNRYAAALIEREDINGVYTMQRIYQIFTGEEDTSCR